MSNAQLTAGSVQAMYNGENSTKPTVQIIDIKKIQGPNTNPGERFRLVISDGIHYQQAMLATQLNHLVIQGIVVQHSIVRLNEHICNTVHGRRIVIILQLDHVSNASGNIGNPQNIEPNAQQQNSNTTANNANANVNPAPYQQNQRQQNNYQAPPPQRQQQYSAPPPSSSSNAYHPPGQSVGLHGAGEDLSGHAIVPVKALNPYQNKWTIKVRVNVKSDIKNYAGKGGNPKPGKLFNFDVIDQEKGEIRITMFNDHVDKFEPMLVKGRVYYISKGTLKIANRRYNNINNEYEITANHETLIQECLEDTAMIPSVSFNFVDISSLSQRAKDDLVDILAVASSIGPVESITSKKSQENLDKRVVMLEDPSGASIELTLWGEQARKFDYQGNPVIAIKGATVSEYNNRSLNALRSTMIDVNPDFEQSHQLRQWFDSPRVNQSQALSTRYGGGASGGGGGSGGGSGERKCMSQIKDQNLGASGNADYFRVKGTITLIKHDNSSDPWYLACSKCQKKVTPGSGSYQCGKCGEVYEAEPRYIISLVANDHTGSSWLSGFNDQGHTILGMSAPDLSKLKGENNSAFEDAFGAAQFKQFNFRVRAKQESYNDEQRVKCNIMNVDPLNYSQECKHLLEQIAKYNTK